IQATGAGTSVFSVDYEGDVVANSLSLTTALTDANVSDTLTIGSSSTVDATTLTGTINSARLSGSYTGITGLGTLTAGATGSGFTLNFGASTLSGSIGDSNIADNLTISASGSVDSGALTGTI